MNIDQFRQLEANVKGKKQEPKPKKKYRSKTEELYANQLQARKLAGEIEEWFYEPITFKLADKLRYTPDFLIMFSSGYGTLEFVEIKGGFIRDTGKVKFKAAREKFALLKFRMIVYSGGNWTEKYPE